MMQYLQCSLDLGVDEIGFGTKEVLVLHMTALL